MRHELIIEKTEGVNDWVTLDVGENVPAIVFQINDLNDLKDRQASYSQSFALPLTPNNCRAFGFADEFDALSDAPYQIHRCAWYEDGIEIIGTDFRLELLSVSDVFNCQIVNNIAGLFETLKSKTMDEMTSIPRLLWNHTTIKSTLESDGPDKLITFAPPLSVQREPGVYSYVQNDRAVLVAGVIPYFRLLPLVRAILGEVGYTLDTDVESVPGYEPDLISMSDFVPGVSSFDPLNRRASGPVLTIGPGAQPSYPIYMLQSPISSQFNYNEVRVRTLRDANVETVTTTGFEYVAPGYMKMRANLMCLANITGDPQSRCRYRVQKFGNPTPGPVADTYEQEVIAEVDAAVSDRRNYDTFVSDEIELAPGERLYLEIMLLEGRENIPYQGNFSVTISPESNAVPAGGYIYPQKSTDFKNQLDVIKLFVQLYGLFVDVDTANKVVRAYNLNKVLNRAKTGDFADWSGKLDTNPGKSSREVTFRVGSYEQENRILFGANSLNDEQKSASIYVRNDNLQAVKDLFTIGAESSFNRRHRSPIIFPDMQDMDVDVRYTQDDAAGWSYLKTDPAFIPWPVWLTTYRKSKTHVVRLVPMKSTGTGSILRFRFDMIPPAYTSVYAEVDEQYAFVPVSVDPQTFINTYYPILENNILNPARLVEDVFNLTPSDIMNLDLLRPVYVEEYGGFFYIQKIHNYQARKLTKVTLVALSVV